MSQFIAIRELADELDIDTRLLRNLARRLDIRPGPVGVPQSGYHPVQAVTEEEAQLIRHAVFDGGFPRFQQWRGAAVMWGQFYVMRPVPELDLRRVKLGFAMNVYRRQRQHRTNSPLVETLRAWPCKQAWEMTVIACLTRFGCTPVGDRGTEVFVCEDISAMLERGDKFFSLMPSPYDGEA